MPNLRTIADLGDITGQTILLRADLDVPIEKGEVSSNYRVLRATKSIQELTSKGARVVILAHLGRPDGEYVDEYSLMPVRFELGKLLNQHIKFAHPQSSKNSITFMENGEVLLLENVRFDPREESSNSKERKEYLEELASISHGYVNDAFASYRPHASTYDLALHFAKSKKAVAGIHLVEELEKLGRLKDNPQRPYVAVIGGAKLDTKIDILNSLVESADTILVGGAMAYTLLKAQGVKVGDSKVQDNMLKDAEKILKKAKKSGVEIMLPVDHVAGKEFSAKTAKVEVDTQQIPAGLVGLDIGERTRASYLEVIKSAKAILWNGPMGVFEWDSFAKGTEAVGEYIALSSSDDAYKVAGGGDTISAIEKLKINMKNFDHVSTGGGAMLSYLAGEDFPTLEPLRK